MSYSKECPGVVTQETQTGRVVSRRRCRYVLGGQMPCKLAQTSDGKNNTHVAEGYCLRGIQDDMPDVKSN